MEGNTRGTKPSKARLWRLISYASLSIVVVFGLASIIATGGGGGGGGTPSPAVDPSLFPADEDIIAPASEITTIIDEDGEEIDVAGSQIIAKFVATASRSDYESLVVFLNSQGAQIVGQMPLFREVQIEAASPDEIMGLILQLEGLPYVEEAAANVILSHLSNNVPPNRDLSGWVSQDRWLWMEMIGAVETWNSNYHGNPNQIIAIVEPGGIPQTARQRYFADQEPQLGGYIGSDIEPDNHITTMAALAGGDSQEFVGVCPDCQTVFYDSGFSLPVMSEEATGDQFSLKKMLKAAIRDRRNVVVNVSFGKEKDDWSDAKWLNEQEKFRWYLRDVIELANENNCLIVLAGGNRQLQMDALFPPAGPVRYRQARTYYENLYRTNSIVVTAIETDKTICQVYGNAIDLAAPGYFGMASIDKSFIVNPGEGQTSSATALVSGAASLIWSYNSYLEAHVVKEILMATGGVTDMPDIKTLSLYSAIMKSFMLDDDYEPDDSFGIATELEIPTYPSIGEQAHTIAPAGDQDYYLFWANAGEIYTFYSSVLTTWITAELLDSAHQTLVSKNAYGYDFVIDWEAPSSGHYYLKIYGYSQETEGSYMLHYVGGLPIPEAPS